MMTCVQLQSQSQSQGQHKLMMTAQAEGEETKISCRGGVAVGKAVTKQRGGQQRGALPRMMHLHPYGMAAPCCRRMKDSI